MADISKIKLPDGSEFNIKDAAAARSADLAAVATSGSYNDLINVPDSDVFVVRTTSSTPTEVQGNLYYPTDKTYAETLAAMRAGKQVVLIHAYEDEYTPSIYYGTSSYETGGMCFTSINFNINVNDYKSINIRSAIFKEGTGVRFTILLNNSTRRNLSSIFYTNNSLPRTSGQPGQVPVVDSNGSYLLNWTNLPTVPTIDTSIDSSSVNTEVASAKAVYDYVTTALGNINTFNVAIVTTLPTQNIDTHTIYFLKPTPAAAGTAVVGEAQVVSENSEENNEYIEWMYINNQWERLGTTSVDLSGYVETNRKINNKALTSDITLTAADVGAIEESDLADVAFSGSYNDLIDTLPIARGEGENSLVENNIVDPWYDEKYTIYITGSGSDFTYTTEDTLPIINSNKLNRYILVDGSSYRKINSIDTTNQTIVIEFNYAAQTDRQVFIYHIVGNVASQNYSHAEGRYVVASGEYSHAEGSSTKATALGSHTEGSATIALSSYSHAEGYASTAKGVASHVEGYQTIANGKSQHVFGEYNIEDTTTNALIKGTYVEIVGNGTSSARSNARTLDWSGNETLAGKLTVGAPGVNSLDAATVGQLPTKTSDLTNDSNFQTTTNLVTTLSSSSTDTQYPSAKAVYDAIAAGGGGGSSPVTYTYTDPNSDGNIIISQHVLGTLDESQF